MMAMDLDHAREVLHRQHRAVFCAVKPDAMDLLVKHYRAISGEHDDWNGYRATMKREQRVILRVSLTGAGPDKTG